MFTSLRSKISLALMGTVLLSTLLTMLFVKEQTKYQISTLQNKNAQYLLETILLSIERQYANLISYEQLQLTKKKNKLNSINQLITSIAEEFYQKHQKGLLGEEEAKQRAQEAIKKMYCANEIVSIWMTDTGRPIPQMIMSSAFPELAGQILNNPSFNSALGLNKNFFEAAVDIVQEHGEGYVTYSWPITTPPGQPIKQAKLSYVKLFKKWNWVIGVEIYLDDVESQTEEHIKSILATLEDTFSRVTIGKSGYLYLVNGDKEFLIHPSLEHADTSKLINPSTGNPILEDLFAAARTPAQHLKYIWDKPPSHMGDFRFWKTSHVRYFEPLDWYIASSVYVDDIETPANDILNAILLLSIIILLFAFILSLLLSRSLTTPLQLLTAAAQKIDYNSIVDNDVPVTGTIETRRLGLILNNMLNSIRTAVQTKEELFEEKLALESRLHQAEKLESVGRLAAGIAHEINTPTQYVDTNIEFLMDASRDVNDLLEQLSMLLATAHKEGQLEDALIQRTEDCFETADWDFLQEEIPKALVQSQEGLRRISKIVSAMKNFSHPGSGELELSDINLGIQSTVTLATNEWKYAAEMDMQLEDSLPLVPCYPDELNQVFLNMIINSAHAIAVSDLKETGKKGLITIATRKSGNYVQIAITDSGGGMPQEVVKKIFEPFYTTKEVGKGTGQGLAIAHDVIVNKHHGTIDVETKLDQGTTFTIKLPINQPS